MAQDWDIKVRDGACRGCNADFTDRQLYYSSLVLNAGEYAREDFCEACWAERVGKIPSYSSWKGIFRMPPPPPEEPLKKENAETLLRKLIEDNNPANLNVIYILAVMLERKRILVEKDVQRREDEALVRVYEHRKTAEVFLVTDPRLHLDQLGEVQDQVVVMLGGRPRGAPPVEAAPAADGAAAEAQVAAPQAAGGESGV